MANVGTPYFKRRIPVLTEGGELTFNDMMSTMQRDGVLSMGVAASPSGVTMDGGIEDPTEGQKIYQPSHPQADKNGLVTLSNTDPMSDMAGATIASRMYEANLSVISVVKQMANKALEIGRGQ